LTAQKKPLSNKPCRKDLTDRECSSILGGVIGGLASMTDLEKIRNAVRWWAESDDAWLLLKSQQSAIKNFGAEGVAN
jgi:hypothetical protein